MGGEALSLDLQRRIERGAGIEPVGDAGQHAGDATPRQFLGHGAKAGRKRQAGLRQPRHLIGHVRGLGAGKARAVSVLLEWRGAAFVVHGNAIPTRACSSEAHDPKTKTAWTSTKVPPISTVASTGT